VRALPVAYNLKSWHSDAAGRITSVTEAGVLLTGYLYLAEQQ
jgi:hypothetical protein